MAYQPIENYGIIGNMHTAALISKSGSIDWFCYPHFDSPSVFGAILDAQKGGKFNIFPLDEHIKTKQFYWPDTNVLVTRFFSHDGVGEVTDYMPVGLREGQHGFHQLIRRVKILRGSMKFKMECNPAFNYGRDSHETRITEKGASFHAPAVSLGLATSVQLEERNNGAYAEFILNEGQAASFVLHRINSADDGIITLSDQKAEELFMRTVDYWHKWISKCTYRGRWREIVYRSALVLKLLTFAPTGAIVAAPTCSLPETLGGSRNWDYRYSWLRDAAFTIYALMRIGFTEEAGNFMKWVEERCHELNPDGSLQTVYGIDGRHVLTEEKIENLEGYGGSRPVRVGNGAYNQMQLDIYGELMDSVYLFNKYGVPISYDLWTHLRRLVNYVVEHWKDKDEGIWEVRGERQHFVYSKLMCWVALDRGLRLAEKRSFPADYDVWLKTRNEIYEDIMKSGWSHERQSFVQYYGGEALDASILLMPLVFFVAPNDPRMLKTLDAINRSPKNGGLVSNSLVYRYDYEKNVDGLQEAEGTFNICTFWLVEALTRAGRVEKEKLHEARFIFEQMLGYANHVGLYAEETGPNGDALGNFPQAFTHLALISAAFNLDRALGEGA